MSHQSFGPSLEVVHSNLEVWPYLKVLYAFRNALSVLYWARMNANRYRRVELSNKSWNACIEYIQINISNMDLTWRLHKHILTYSEHMWKGFSNIRSRFKNRIRFKLAQQPNTSYTTPICLGWEKNGRDRWEGRNRKAEHEWAQNEKSRKLLPHYKVFPKGFRSISMNDILHVLILTLYIHHRLEFTYNTNVFTFSW